MGDWEARVIAACAIMGLWALARIVDHLHATNRHLSNIADRLLDIENALNRRR